MAGGMGVIVILVVFLLMGDTLATAGPAAPLIFRLAALLLLVNVLGCVELAISVSSSSIEPRIIRCGR
jgi:amino acid transporter